MSWRYALVYAPQLLQIWTIFFRGVIGLFFLFMNSFRPNSKNRLARLGRYVAGGELTLGVFIPPQKMSRV